MDHAFDVTNPYCLFRKRKVQAFDMSRPNLPFQLEECQFFNRYDVINMCKEQIYLRK